MRTQHVLSLPASASLPRLAGLPNGYAVIRDGRTWVVRGGEWVMGIADPSPADPIPPDPNNPPPDPGDPPPPPPSLVTLPTPDEVLGYRYGWAGMRLLKVKKYTPSGQPKIMNWPVEVTSNTIPGCLVSGDGTTLLVRRPGYYGLNLTTTLGTVPAGRRIHVVAEGHAKLAFTAPGFPIEATGPSGGHAEALHLPGQLSANGGAVVYCPDPDDDPYLGNGGGALKIYLEDEMPAGAGALPMPYETQVRLTPILFTGPVNLPADLPVITDVSTFETYIEVDGVSQPHLALSVSAAYASSVRWRKGITRTLSDPSGTPDEAVTTPGDEEWLELEPNYSATGSPQHWWYGYAPWTPVPYAGIEVTWEIQAVNPLGRASFAHVEGSLGFPT